MRQDAVFFYMMNFRLVLSPFCILYNLSIGEIPEGLRIIIWISSIDSKPGIANSQPRQDFVNKDRITYIGAACKQYVLPVLLFIKLILELFLKLRSEKERTES